jgi:hypothetical protein
MRIAAVVIAVLTCALLAPQAQADTYPISGRWGVGTPSADGKIDCNGKRVITFSGNQRQDSKGGVPAFRNRTVTPQGTMRFRVVDEFTTGQISNAHANYTLHLIDDDRVEMQMQPGGMLTLQRCK